MEVQRNGPTLSARMPTGRLPVQEAELGFGAITFDDSDAFDFGRKVFRCSWIVCIPDTCTLFRSYRLMDTENSQLFRRNFAALVLLRAD